MQEFLRQVTSGGEIKIRGKPVFAMHVQNATLENQGHATVFSGATIGVSASAEQIRAIRAQSGIGGEGGGEGRSTGLSRSRSSTSGASAGAGAGDGGTGYSSTQTLEDRMIALVPSKHLRERLRELQRMHSSSSGYERSGALREEIAENLIRLRSMSTKDIRKVARVFMLSLDKAAGAGGFRHYRSDYEDSSDEEEETKEDTPVVLSTKGGKGEGGVVVGRVPSSPTTSPREGSKHVERVRLKERLNYNKTRTGRKGDVKFVQTQLDYVYDMVTVGVRQRLETMLTKIASHGGGSDFAVERNAFISFANDHLAAINAILSRFPRNHQVTPALALFRDIDMLASSLDDDIISDRVILTASIQELIRKIELLPETPQDVDEEWGDVPETASGPRPIPRATGETLTHFHSFTGTAPRWFRLDDDDVQTIHFHSIKHASQWLERHPNEARRVFAKQGNDTYWVQIINGGIEVVSLDANKQPDFSIVAIFDDSE